MINRVDSVSIDLRILDPKLAQKEDGVERRKMTSVGEKLNARHHKAKHWWNTFFIISCAFAVFNDPIFCYMNAIDDENKCITTDRKLATTYIYSRTFTDVFYLVDFLISKGGCCRRIRKSSCWSCFPNLLPTLSRIYVFLPIAQILVSRMTESHDPNSRNFLFLTSLQSILRIYYIYGSLNRRPIIDITGAERWLRPILGFVPFILASHESQERSNKLLLKEKKQLMKPYIDLWLSKNNLSKDMETVVTKKKKKNLKNLIMENIHKLEENSDLDVQNILSVLPIKDKQSIMCVLFLASLKKVPVFQTIDEKVLKAICQHLVPVTYTEDSHIVQEGRPIGKMLLFTHGSAVTYSHGGTSNGSSSNKWLKKGDFYGDELLNWAFKPPLYLDLPISTENVIAQEKVEAFAIRAGDLKIIFFNFWWVFSREVNASQLEQWKHLAASSIQAAWRHHQARIRLTSTYIQPSSRLRHRAKTISPTHWNRFVVD